MLDDKTRVEASLMICTSPGIVSRSSSQLSGDWLFALPIASCGLRLDDEAVRSAVSSRLGLDLANRGIPHHCHCGSTVDARGLHSFVCRRASGTSARHHALNDLSLQFRPSRSKFPSLKTL